MDLVFPQNLKPNTLSWPSSSPPFLPWSSKPWRPRTLTPASKPKHVKIRSEFDGKVNGSLSNDFDPRVLDRVYLTPLSFSSSLAVRAFVFHSLYAILCLYASGVLL